MVAARSNAAVRMPRRGAPSLSNKSRGGGGSIVVKLVFLALIAGAGYFGWKQFTAYKARPRPVSQQPVKPVVVEEPDPEPPKKVVAAKPKPKRKRRLTELERDEELIRQYDEQERRKKALENDPAEIARRQQEALKRQQEADAKARARFEETQAEHKAALEQVAAARKDPAAKPLHSLKGFRFGTVQEGVPSVWGPILDGGDSVNDCGMTYAVYGNEVTKPIGTLGKSPLLWVTPKTKRIFRVEFFRDLVLPKKSRHDAETPSLVDMMKNALKRDPVVTRKADPALPGVEYVFPAGDTTVRIGEYGDKLKMVAEHEGLRREAKAEADELRTAKANDKSEDDLLVSTSYPQGPAVSYKGLISRFREGTPKSFCGLNFGRLPPEGATIVNPKNGEKGFFLDYERAKCQAFKGFTVGKADIDRYRGGLFAVTLYNSDGGQDGLDDATYFKSVREALDRQYLVKPVEKPGTREFPELVYEKGDVRITFGPNHNGGFRLHAVNQVLADIAKIDPSSRTMRRGK